MVVKKLFPRNAFVFVDLETLFKKIESISSDSSVIRKGYRLCSYATFINIWMLCGPRIETEDHFVKHESKTPNITLIRVLLVKD